MTINIGDNDPRVSYSVAEGATQTSFVVDFEFFDDADLTVYVDGTLKTLVTDYTVSGGAGSTGSITMSVTGAAGGSTVVIFRSITLERTTDFPVSGQFNITALNTELDRVIAVQADLKDQIDRSLKLPDYDPTVDVTLPDVDFRKGRTLAFNETTGTVEAGPTISDVQSVSAASADIARLADIEDGTLATNAIQTVAGVASNVATVAGIATDVTGVAAIDANVTTVALDGIDIGVVSANIGNVNTVAGISANVTTVAGVSADVTTVAGISANTTTVAGIAGDVTTVAGISANVTAVAGDALDIGTVSANIGNVNTVAGIAPNVTTVAGISANVTAVAADAIDIGNVSGSIANVNTVATNIANVNTVAGISANVTTTATDSANIGLVAGSISNVNTVATNILDVNTAAANITEIQNASTNAATATTKASEAATSASSALSAQSAAESARDSALAAFDNFDDKYLGSKTSDPTTDNDGNPLVAGSLYFNSVDGAMKVYTGSAWVAAYASLSGALLVTNNLSDVNSVSAARTNLGLGTAATTASTDYATAAQGALADSAIQPSDLGTAATLNVGTSANQIVQLDGSAKLPALDGSQLTGIVSIPTGLISLWSGSTASIPSGWQICDGTNGTPDLRDRFVVGAGSSYLVGGTGGAASIALVEAQLPSHTHGGGTLATGAGGDHSHNFNANTGNSGNHAHNGSTSNTGNHSHSIAAGLDYAQSTWRIGVGRRDPIDLYGYTDTTGAHSHNFTTAGAGDHSHNFNANTNASGNHTHSITGTTGATGSGTAHENRPPYYALAYIMKL